ncbi:MAG TPA: sensor histidine kinase [Ruminococcus sp.]|nr:sensor histidine kinase [Ruminococcus sp.]
MRILNQPGNRKLLVISAAVTALGFGICCLFSIPSALILLCVSLTVTAAAIAVRRSEDDRILELCDTIDKVLRGDDTFVINSFTDGNISILATEIQKMTVRLREQNSALETEKRFMKESLEDLSHQLRTPLTSMMLILNNIRSRKDAGQLSRSLRELMGLLAQMQWLIETMLNISRIDAGAMTLRIENVSCRELIRKAEETVSVSLELKGITMHTEVKGEPELNCDVKYLTEAVINILKNSMEHTPEGGEITVELEENPIYTGIMITDTGTGIPEEDIDQIFSRFYRSPHSHSSGFGIGLAFARRIIAMHNGVIKAGNSSQGGAQFDIRFYKTVV